jgi:membrane protein
VLPGFRGVSLYSVTAFYFEGIVEGAITTRASSLAFNFFLAFFPSVIVLFSLIPYIQIDGFQEELFILLQEVFPPKTYDATKSTLDDIVTNQNGGLLSIGFLFAVYFSTNGVNSLIEAFNATIHIKESRPILKQRLVSLFLTGVLGVLLFLAITIILTTQNFMDYLVEKELVSNYVKNTILQSKWIILSTLLYAGISCLYYFGPASTKKWRFFSPGSITATIVMIGTSLAFSYYVDHFAKYNKLYGSIGTLMIVLLWMYFNSIILLLGFELNASIVYAKSLSEREPGTK